jgi:HSP20 family protein
MSDAAGIRCAVKEEKAMVNRLPASNAVTLGGAMDRLVNEAFSGTPFRTIWSASGNSGARRALPLDIYATGDEIVMIAAIPGITPEDIDVTIDKGTVTLHGTTPNVARSEEASEATWYLHELPHGNFSRSVTLPVEVDANAAEATFEHGILRLRLPKAEAAKPRRIEVRPAATEAIATTSESSES